MSPGPRASFFRQKLRSMAMRALFVLAALTLPASATIDRQSRGFLTAGMQPEVVAEKLVGVEDKWQSFADTFIECSGSNATEISCNASTSEFKKSCDTVVTAIVQGSSGQRGVVKEYMETVCGVNALSGWRREQCQSLAVELNKVMSDDSYDNREDLDTTPICQAFWSKLSSEEKVRLAKLEAERKAEEDRKAEEERKAAEERAKEEAARKEAEEKAAAEAAAEEKKAEAEEAKKKAEEAKEKAEEAKRHLEEAKRNAANVTTKVNATVMANTTNAAVANTTVASAPKAAANASAANTSAANVSK